MFMYRPMTTWQLLLRYFIGALILVGFLIAAGISTFVLLFLIIPGAFIFFLVRGVLKKPGKENAKNGPKVIDAEYEIIDKDSHS